MSFGVYPGFHLYTLPLHTDRSCAMVYLQAQSSIKTTGHNSGQVMSVYKSPIF